jgi:hypothetical protein
MPFRHSPEELKVKLQRKNCDLVVIHSSMSSHLQPLNVVVNKPFKDHLRKEYKDWLLSEKLSLTPSAKITKASTSKLEVYVLAAWKNSTEKNSGMVVLQMHLIARRRLSYIPILTLTALI